MNVLAVTNDIIFRTKIESTAKSLGAAVLRNADAIGEEPGVVLIDLDTAWPEAQELVRAVSAKADVRLVAFGSHVRQDLFEQARAAGIKDVFARSVFVTKLPTILQGAA